ncbi:outer membrane protein assembly factor BamB family protein [Pontibacter cellulosilyticus]|uniref:PQQ-binding-like beta-propeller repeat protein n=1 Tax=Pontibacter cellulosilyticus TaxID=1720253 RepID=A0A923N7X8_9BACT|nr:PQQ-binding-like beta-propeller repeat protein [Pontibacter cellulosilyticus]MBC5992120.1 PQQ-binding-like beta-propeller repeat protein [Pontibacter cellulosilyticus]
MNATLVKYSPEGRELWKVQYSATDAVQGYSVEDIVADNKGDVYVLAIKGNYGPPSMIIYKYDGTNGTLLWSVMESVGRINTPKQILVDNIGGVLVSGFAVNSGPGFSYIIKYSASDGSWLWDKNFIGQLESYAEHIVTDIAIDEVGDIYATGTKNASHFGSSDIVTLKYSGLDGKVLWRQDSEIVGKEYSGELVVSGDEVYITGTVASSTAPAEILKSFLIKYSASDGAMQWSQDTKLDSNLIVLKRLVSDGSGGVVAAGYQGENAYLLRYGGGGGQVQWLVPFAGKLMTLETDKLGGLYAAGFTPGAEYVIVKYNILTGQQLWEYAKPSDKTQVDLLQLSVSGSGAYIAGVSTNKDKDFDNLFLARHRFSDGANLWTIVGSGEDPAYDSPVDVLTDAEGNVIVAGSSTSRSGEIASAFVIKYSAEGETEWLNVLEAGRRNEIVGMAVDAKGDVFITGTRKLLDNSQRHFTIKYNGTDGAKLWEHLSNIGQTSFTIKDIKVDNIGGAYVVGVYSEGSPIVYNDYLVKLDSQNGSVLWSKINDQSSSLYGFAAFTVDERGNVYVTGSTSNTASNYDITTIKYNGTDGSVIWSNVLDKTVNDAVTHLAIDKTGGVYIVGYNSLDPNNYLSVNPFLLKYDASSGNQLWYQAIESKGNSTLTIKHLIADSEGRVYTRGTDPFSEQIFAYDSENGKQEWSFVTDGYITDVTVDGKGGLYFTNAVNRNEIHKHNALNGQKVWSLVTPQEFRRITVDKDLNVIVAGVIDDPVTHWDNLTVKYSQQEDPCNIPVEARLYLPPVAKRVGWQVRTTADFRPYILGANHGVSWSWGDGSTSSIAYTALGTSRITGEHTYQQAGIYQIGLDFSQSCLKPANAGYEQWMPVFDPEAGFVTGAGQTEGIRFNLNARYSGRFATEPQGSVQLDMEGLGRLRSADLEWLVVSGDKAAFRGEGTIDGRGRYGFTLSVTDAGSPGANDAGDRLRVQVWDLERHSRVVYDNGSSQILDLSNQGPTIQRGNIVIHRPGKASMAAKAGSKAQAAEGGSQLTAYPNTFSERTAVSFSLGNAQNYTLEVYDTRGRLVRQLASGNAKAGSTYEYELSGQGLNEGLYIARLVTNAGTQSIKLLLKR